MARETNSCANLFQKAKLTKVQQFTFLFQFVAVLCEICAVFTCSLSDPQHQNRKMASSSDWKNLGALDGVQKGLMSFKCLHREFSLCSPQKEGLGTQTLHVPVFSNSGHRVDTKLKWPGVSSASSLVEALNGARSCEHMLDSAGCRSFSSSGHMALSLPLTGPGAPLPTNLVPRDPSAPGSLQCGPSSLAIHAVRAASCPECPAESRVTDTQWTWLH